jgi:hypothetical protein
MADPRDSRNSRQALNLQVEDVPLVEPATEADLHSLAADELFMNALVDIYVYPVTDENAAPYVILNCNGVNQPIARGVVQSVKRKFVEILARMKETKYNQIQPNASEPDNRQLVARTGLCYPFEIHKDSDPRGRPWLLKVLAEVA